VNDSNYLWNSRTQFNIWPTYSLHFRTFPEINLHGTSNPLKFLLLYLHCVTWIWGVPLMFWTHSLHSLSLSLAVFAGIRQMHLPSSVVLPVDAMSRLSGMCTCVTLRRHQVEGLEAAIFYRCFPQSLHINKIIMS